MTIVLPPALEDRIRQIARAQGRDVESVVGEALRSFVEKTSQNGLPAAAPSAPPNGSSRYPLRGTVIRFDDPHGPAAPESDWEALR
jgi:hypothetical protein